MKKSSGLSFDVVCIQSCIPPYTELNGNVEILTKRRNESLYLKVIFPTDILIANTFIIILLLPKSVGDTLLLQINALNDQIMKIRKGNLSIKLRGEMIQCDSQKYQNYDHQQIINIKML